MSYELTQCEIGALNAAIDRGARVVNAARRPGKAAGFRASGLSGCLRRRGYELLATEPTDETFVPDYSLAADQGTIIHERLQKWLVNAGLVFQYPGFGPAVEVPLSTCCPPEDRALLDGIPFSGHIDAILDHGGRLSILDIKTVASKYLAGGDSFMGDYPWLAGKLQGYAVQLHAYMRFCAAPDGRRADRAFVLMISRDDTSKRRLYGVPFQEEAWQQEWQRLECAAAAVKAGELPEADPERGPCVFCPFRTKCEGER